VRTMKTEEKQRPNANGTEFSAIIAIFWKQRMLIIFGILATTFLAGAVSFFIPKTYCSEGFYQLGNPKKTIIETENERGEKVAVENKDFIGVPIPFFKKNSPQFFNLNLFRLGASQEKSFSAKDLKDINDHFRTAGDIGKWIKPVFAYAREDVREFAQVGKNEVNSVIGLNLSYEADSPQKAWKYVWFFGNYVRDCLLYVTLYDYVMDKHLTSKSQMNIADNVIIQTRFNLLQNTKKMLDINKILTRYPAAAKMENWQLFSVQEGGYRFLAPVTQLVGIESDLADQRRELSKLEREKEKIMLDLEYFSRCKNELEKENKSGVRLFDLLKAIKADMFKNKDLSKDTVKEVANNLSIDLQTFDLAFFTNCRFVSGPTIPIRHIKPKKSVILIAAFFSSAFFFLFLVLFLSWWRDHKQSILMKAPKE
jgi:hypothetical protein